MAPYVCAATPHNRLQPAMIRSVFLQTWRGHIDHHFTSRNDDPVPGMNIVHAYQRLRAMFLAEPAYTHLWIVENDLIIPPDALERLLKVCEQADIAYALYVFRRGINVNIMRHDTTDPITNDPVLWARAWGKVVPCAGLGFGCTLIQRHVLERFPMRTEIGGGDADTCLARDAKKAGLVQQADLGLVCGHIDTDDTVLWPTARRPFYRRVGVRKPDLADVRMIVGQAVWDEHLVPMLLAPGQTARIDREVATNWVARGMAEWSAPAFKDVQ